MTRRIVLALLAAAVVLLVGLAAWRALPAADEDEVLVLRERAHAGPLRAYAAPWAARVVVPARARVALDLTADLGQGSTWPLRAEAEISVDPARLDDAGRSALIDAQDLAALVRGHAGDALRAALAGTSGREILARPAALGVPLRGALGARLPPGIAVEGVTVAVLAPPEQARAAALSSARAAAVPPLTRILHVGLDGADWRIVDEMVARGELPTFARLQREGVRADLQSYEPMMSPLLWTTALTGRTPDEHGIADFTLRRGPGEGEMIPITSRFRKVPAVWEIYAAAGQASAFVNHWGSQPAEEVPGVLVSDLAPKTIGLDAGAAVPAGVAWPPGYLAGLRGRFVTLDSVPDDLVRAYAPALTARDLAAARAWARDPAAKEQWEKAQTTGRKTPPDVFLLTLATASHNVEAIAADLLRRADLGVVSVYFEDIDIAGHNFQHLAPPPHALAPPDERKYAGVVEACYRQQDAMLGRLIAAAGPDTAVIVHSDHGFHWRERRPVDIAPYTNGQPVEWHSLRGLFVAAGGPFRRGVRVPAVTLFDIAPTLLALRGVPPGGNMPGRVRDDLLVPEAASRLPRERVPSWDPLVPPRAYEDASEEDLAAARAAALEQLKGLGYVGDDEHAGTAPASAAATDAGTAERGEQEERPAATYWRNLATWLLNENRFEDAERALLEANKVTPLPKTYQLISESRALRGDLAGAAAILEEGMRALPTKVDASSLLWIVDLRLRQGDLTGAERFAAEQRERLARDPDIAATIEGRLADARGDEDAARTAYRRALEADPRTSQALQRLVALARGPEERAALEPYVVEGLSRDQRIELYWEVLGLLRSERGDHKGAAEAFHRAAELEPRNEAVRLNEGIAWMRAGDKARARAAYEDLARLGARQPAAWINLGSLRAEAGDWRGALDAWERARGLGGASPQLDAGIAEARRRVGAGS